VGTGLLDEEKIHQHLLGKEIVFNKHYIIADGARYESPSYKIKEKDFSKHLIWHWGIYQSDMEAIGIDDTANITIFEILLADKETRPAWPTINFSNKKNEECSNEELFHINEMAYYNGELYTPEDWYCFHLKKVR
jgi:hypothetical protein